VSSGPEFLLVGAVAGVGVLHTVVPDHWLPLALLARQRGWSKTETARAAVQAGIGHVLSTLLLAIVFWAAGTILAARFGRLIDAASSLALMGFGAWITCSAWLELHRPKHPPHHHPHLSKTSNRTALLLILGSSPMVEGIPAFFAAAKYGVGLLGVMTAVFAISTVATYVLMSVSSAAGLQKLRLGSIERYGEVLSGAFIVLVGLVFGIWLAI
jgi:hypothetical protein